LLTFDLETTNHDYGSAINRDNKVVMVAWCVDDGPVKSFYGHWLDAREFWHDLDKQKVLCAHNAKFEMLWLKRAGIDIHNFAWHDTMLAQRVLAGNRQWPMNLGEVSAYWGFPNKDPYIDEMMKKGVCPSEMPMDDLIARCRRDVRTTREVMKQQLKKLNEMNMLHLYRNRAQFCPVLAEMEYNGMYLDAERTNEEHEKHVKEVAALKNELDMLTGGVNLRSPDQMAHYLYGELKFPEKVGNNRKPMRNKPSKQFPGGRPLTDKGTLEWLKGKCTTAEQKRFLELKLEYGIKASALSKNLDFFQGVCKEQGELFHGRYNQTVAATHRLTSSGLPITFADGKKRSVQFQNMPRVFKRLFRAPSDDYYIVEADAPQLEFRVGVFAGQDTQGMRDVVDPRFDAHCTSAAVMNELDYDTLFDQMKGGSREAKKVRQSAKSETFKPLYGGEKGTPAQERWYKEFRRRYPGIASVQELWASEVVANDGTLKLPWGMRFYWETKFNYRGDLFDARRNKPLKPQIFNYPVQNLATAEIVPIAIVALFRRCRDLELDVIFVNTVHDSVICYVNKKHIERFKDCCRWAFTEDVYGTLKNLYGLTFNIPLGVEITWGDYWGEGRERLIDDAQEYGAKFYESAN
jgi:DNA polymerase I-like protein with 3'-5' exonuclease and polymerase domains